jgi:ketosteroid isomerase-like protein
MDPGGREMEQGGRCTFSICRMGDDWKIVAQHFSLMPTEDALTK